nr:2-amino-4-hydroxy-6-hydroxymethyldihydropteridine diphosphokinase [Pedobacter sp.]
VEIKTVLDPPQLLETVLQIEADLGRIRYEKWGSRAIDIDIILYEDEIVDIAEKLQIPHPEMQNRRFVLLPLTEIAPMVIHPILKQNISQLLEDLADNLTVLKR